MVGRRAESLRGAAALILVLLAAPLGGDEAEDLLFLRRRIEREVAIASSKPAAKPTKLRQVNEAKLALAIAIASYQRLLSSQDGAVCSFSLSCSQYAKLAIERYGLARGLVMAADRLQRCNGWGAVYYPRDPTTGKLYDPLP